MRIPFRSCFVLLASCSVLIMSACVRPRPAIDREAAQSTLAWLQTHYRRIDEAESTELMKKVVSRLVAVSDTPEIARHLDHEAVADARSYPWNVIVLAAQEPNAFSLGDGTLVLTGGLVLALQNEAELAFVLAHEMSHVLLGHVSEALRRQQSVLQGASPMMAFLPEEEKEADRLALQLLYHARYEPAAAISALAVYYRQPVGLDAPQSSQEKASSDLMAERLSTLEQQILAFDTELAATSDSRLFTRARRSLSR